MAGINVLSDTLKVVSKLEKTSTPRGKDVSDSPENVASMFAAMLSGSMNLNTDPKGQGFSLADQESEEKQSAGKSEQSIQNANAQGSMLGYRNLALLNLFQPLLQSDLPAGKEANSGNDVSQGTERLAIANSLSNAPVVLGDGYGLAKLNLASLDSNVGLASTGMAMLNPQGDNLSITELDKYRQVIGDLLVALSGKITDTTPEGTLLSSESTGTNNLRQEMAKIVQGWMTVTDDAPEEGQASSGQAMLSNGSVAKALEHLVALSAEITDPVLKGNSAGSGTKDVRQEMAKIVQGWMTVTDDAGEATSGLVNSSVASNSGTKDLRQEMAQKGLQGLIEGLAAGNSKGTNPELNLKAANLLAALYPIFIEASGGAKVPQGVKEALMNQLKSIGIGIESSATAPKDTVFLTNVLQKSEGTGLQESKNLNFKDTFSGEVNKVNSIKSVDLFGPRDGQTQPSSSEVGVVVNVVPLTLSDGKVIAVPVWEQVSNVVREQLILKQQALRQLDIQLHPADLGRIQISLRWESGQVHMQVQASEAATGQLLQNQLSDLRQNLTNQGVNCGSLQMGQGGERQQQSQGDEAQRAFQQSNSLQDEDEDMIRTSNPLTHGPDGINRINVTA